MHLDSIIYSPNPKMIQNKIREYLRQEHNINPPSNAEITNHFFRTKNLTLTLSQKIKKKNLSFSDFETVSVEPFGNIPSSFVQLVNFIQSESTHVGMFRVSPNSRQLDELLDKLGDPDWLDNSGVYEAAGVFLKILSAFGGPVISKAWGPCVHKSNRAGDTLLFYVLSLLPIEMTSFLKYAMSCLFFVASKSSENMMDAVNLSTVVMPAVIDHVGCPSRSSLKDTLTLERLVVERLITQWRLIGMYDREMISYVKKSQRSILSNMSSSCAKFAKKAAIMSRSMFSSTRIIKRTDLPKETVNSPKKIRLFDPFKHRVTSEASPKKMPAVRKKTAVKPLVEVNVPEDMVVFEHADVGVRLFDYSSTDSDDNKAI